MNADGSVSADMRRKLKQVGHLLDLFRPVVARICAGTAKPVVWELNCGSSYLGLLLLDLARREFGKEAALTGVDQDPARVDACRRRAFAAGFPDADFVHGATETAPLPGRPELVLSLHGCDTATDAALRRAVEAEAATVAVVPCCHRELRGVLRAEPPHDIFLRDGVAGGEYCALLTDVVRVAAMRAAGYRADLIEFVPWEHTPKNRLIRADRTGRKAADAAATVETVAAACTARPACARIAVTD
jgi:hypothetical protein